MTVFCDLSRGLGQPIWYSLWNVKPIDTLQVNTQQEVKQTREARYLTSATVYQSILRIRDALESGVTVDSAIDNCGLEISLCIAGDRLVRYGAVGGLVSVDSTLGRLTIGLKNHQVNNKFAVTLREEAGILLVEEAKPPVLTSLHCLEIQKHLPVGFSFQGFTESVIVFTNWKYSQQQVMRLMNPASVNYTVLYPAETLVGRLLRRAKSSVTGGFNFVPGLDKAKATQTAEIAKLPAGVLSVRCDLLCLKNFAMESAQVERYSSAIGVKPNMDTAVGLLSSMENLMQNAMHSLDKFGSQLESQDVQLLDTRLATGERVNYASRGLLGIKFNQNLAEDLPAQLTLANVRASTQEKIQQLKAKSAECARQFKNLYNPAVQQYIAAVQNVETVLQEQIKANVKHEIFLKQLQAVLSVEIRAHHNNLLLGPVAAFCSIKEDGSIDWKVDELTSLCKELTKDMDYRYQDCDYWVGLRAGWKQDLDGDLTSGDRTTNDFYENVDTPFITVAPIVKTNLGLSEPNIAPQIATHQTYTSCKKTSTVIAASYGSARPRMVIQQNSLMQYLADLIQKNKEATEVIAILGKAVELVQGRLKETAATVALAEKANLQSVLYAGIAADLAGNLANIEMAFKMSAEPLSSDVWQHSEFAKLSNSVLENQVLSKIGIQLVDTSSKLSIARSVRSFDGTLTAQHFTGLSHVKLESCVDKTIGERVVKHHIFTGRLADNPIQFEAYVSVTDGEIALNLLSYSIQTIDVAGAVLSMDMFANVLSALNLVESKATRNLIQVLQEVDELNLTRVDARRYDAIDYVAALVLYSGLDIERIDALLHSALTTCVVKYPNIALHIAADFEEVIDGLSE